MEQAHALSQGAGAFLEAVAYRSDWFEEYETPVLAGPDHGRRE